MATPAAPIKCAICCHLDSTTRRRRFPDWYPRDAVTIMSGHAVCSDHDWVFDTPIIAAIEEYALGDKP